MFNTLYRWGMGMISSVLIGLLLSCGGTPLTQTPVAPTILALLKPGDHIGDMIVTKTLPAFAIDSIVSYCDVPETTAPRVTIVPCTQMPVTSPFSIEPGWSAKTPQRLEVAWAALQWHVFIDGHELDLSTFGTNDTDLPNGDKLRSWSVFLEHITPGDHTVHVIQHVSQPFQGTSHIIIAGDYDTTYQFTVKR